MLKQLFLAQAALYADDTLAHELWQQIEDAYASPDRHYHTLAHLQQMLNELLLVKEQTEDWNTLFFSLCYHDVVYDAVHNMVAHDNEERSADVAENALKQLGYPAEKIGKCREQILATKGHLASPDKDTNFLTDADICILGQSWEVYAAYKQNIRKEYQIYPDRLFYAGRKKMLEQFLRMEPLFKTAHFQHLYEQEAKANLRKEYRLLQA